MADLYEILGVSKNASGDEIRRAYRKLAQQHHPDKSGGDDKKFREVNEAYEVLSDSEKRRQYDQFGTTAGQAGGDPFSGFAQGFGGFGWQQDAGTGFDFGDIFSDIFGFGSSRGSSRRTRGVDLEIPLELTFNEAVFGATKTVKVQKNDKCNECSGTGAKAGSKVKNCPKCHGQGNIRRMQRTILGNIATSSTCDQCDGRGKVPEVACQTCSGRGYKQQIKDIEVIVPPGIDDDQRIRLAGQGDLGYKGSNPGDLYVRVRVESHPKLKRDGFNIYSESPVSFYQAALGTRVDVETVDGDVELKIPSGIQSGKVLVLRGKGVPHLSSKRRGDHLVTVRVVTPTKLSKKEKELLQKMAEEKGELVDIEESLWDRIKGQFE